MESYLDRLKRLEERRRRGVHEWDYEHPNCLWEEMTWWVRWPMAVVFILFFSGAFMLPIIVLLHSCFNEP